VVPVREVKLPVVDVTVVPVMVVPVSEVNVPVVNCAVVPVTVVPLRVPAMVAPDANGSFLLCNLRLYR
jgi:hypothetical protein